MTSQSHLFFEFLSANHTEMIDKLHQWCRINSGTSSLQGLSEMHEVLKAAFLPLADEIHSHQLPPFLTTTMAGIETEQSVGKLLYIRKRPHLARRVLLCGHMDTVYDAHHPFQHLREINSFTLNGPGVADMKGGIIVMLYALLAFEQSPIAQSMGWDVVINADEEWGSPASRFFIEKIAKQYQAGLVYEPTLDIEGNYAKNRKGSGKFTVVATGKSAHVGRAFNEGRNAITYLANVIGDIAALNQQRDGVTLNIGLIQGGEALNVVPGKATLKIDVRIEDQTQALWAQEALNNVIQRHQKTDYTLTLTGEFSRPVKRINAATIALFERLQLLGKALNLSLDWKDSGGCCDGNNLAHNGLAVIDTLGVRGGSIHTADEFILLDSLVERSTLSALLLNDLASGSLEQISTQSI